MQPAIVKKSQLLGILVTLLSAILMGVYPSAAQWSYQHGANSSFIVVITTFSRLLVLYLTCVFINQKIFAARRSNWRPILLGGLMQAISIICILSSVALIPGPVALTILFTHTLMLYLLSLITGEEKFTKLAAISTLAALLGVTLVVGLWDTSAELNVLGVCSALLAAVATMGRAYLFGHQVKNDHPMIVGVWTFIVAFPLTLLLLPFHPIVMPADMIGFVAAFLAALFLGLGTIATFYGVALLGAFQFSLFLKLEPVFTALFSICILGEFLSLKQYIGMLVVLMSLVSYQVLAGRKVRIEDKL